MFHLLFGNSHKKYQHDHRHNHHYDHNHQHHGDDHHHHGAEYHHHGDDNTLHMKVIHLTSNGSAEEKVRLMFRMYDKNGNGSIDAREMNE